MGEAEGDGGDAARLGERVSLREQVRRAIRAALVTGDMRPGVVYSAPALASRFGVSATPVREALLDLAKDGFVEPVRNKGFRVRSLSTADIDEIYHLRRLLEIPTVTELARQGCPEALPALRALADETVEAVREGDVLAYVDADHRFHTALLGLAGNERLVHLVAELRAQVRLYGLRPIIARGDVDAATGEHHRLLDHIEAKDPVAAAELMERHITRSRRMASIDESGSR
jgi:DNA-binding GntR family transcriptional regulator